MQKYICTKTAYLIPLKNGTKLPIPEVGKIYDVEEFEFPKGKKSFILWWDGMKRRVVFTKYMLDECLSPLEPKQPTK